MIFETETANKLHFVFFERSKKMNHKFIQSFMHFVDESHTAYQTIEECKKQLKEVGYHALPFSKSWNLEYGKKYYTCPYDTMLFAFAIPESVTQSTRFRIISSHTDYPCFRIKPNADLYEHGFHKLNVESYGGAILNTWLDRPLSIAGKVMLASQQAFCPESRIIDFHRPMLSIPNLAIHMNHEVNAGVALNKQIDLMPVIALSEKGESPSFVEILAKELDVEADTILDYDLYLYATEKSCLWGANDEFCSAPRLDNLSSVFGQLYALTHLPEDFQQIAISAFYDNEEVGSKTKQGADSSITSLFLNKLIQALSFPRDCASDLLFESFMLSADVAHATHPNHREKHDVTNLTKLNQGIVLKLSGTQRYATDTAAIAILQQLCQKAEIPYQKFVNRSDIPGGSTLGSLTSSWLPMQTVDLGIPILAMHSIREMAGVQDIASLCKLFQAFYTEA